MSKIEPYTKLPRTWTSSKSWTKCKPFDKWRAWIDLVAMAAFADHEAYDKDDPFNPILIKRGDSHTSIKFLEKRWGWSYNKVDNFLVKLEKSGSISQKRTNRNTILTICNYNKIQDTPNVNGNTDPQKWGSDGNPDGNPDGNANGIQHNKGSNNKGINNQRIIIKGDKKGVPRLAKNPPKSFELKFQEAIQGKECFGRYNNVWLTPQDLEEFRRSLDNGSENGTEPKLEGSDPSPASGLGPVLSRCIEKLDAWVEQDKSSRALAGANAAATFYAWVINSVTKEKAEAQKVNGRATSFDDLPENPKTAVLRSILADKGIII